MAVSNIWLVVLVLQALLVPRISCAAWVGPNNLVVGEWGKSAGHFGIEQGDTGDVFPLLEAVTLDGEIVITDIVNSKQLVFGLDGSMVKEVSWIQESSESGITRYIIPEYSFGTVLGFASNGKIYVLIGGNYFLLSSTGEILLSYTERPPDVGIVEEKKIEEDQYKVTVKYPDKEWTIMEGKAFPRYMRDINGNLYGIGDIEIARYDTNGSEVSRLTMPESRFIETPSEIPGVEPIINVIEHYGSPVLAPNGDVYAWKRTLHNYYIIKWTWQD